MPWFVSAGCHWLGLCIGAVNWLRRRALLYVIGNGDDVGPRGQKQEDRRAGHLARRRFPKICELCLYIPQSFKKTLFYFPLKI